MDALKEAGARFYIGHSELSLRKCNFSSSPDAIVFRVQFQLTMWRFCMPCLLEYQCKHF